jgi:hypothetical protein
MLSRQQGTMWCVPGAFGETDLKRLCMSESREPESLTGMFVPSRIRPVDKYAEKFYSSLPSLE